MPVRIGPQLPVADLIARAKAQGCELRISKATLVTPWGEKNIRFLFNPANRGRFDLTDIEDDESILGSEIESASRRLGITLP